MIGGLLGQSVSSISACQKDLLLPVVPAGCAAGRLSWGRRASLQPLAGVLDARGNATKTRDAVLRPCWRGRMREDAGARAKCCRACLRW